MAYERKKTAEKPLTGNRTVTIERSDTQTERLMIQTYRSLGYTVKEIRDESGGIQGVQGYEASIPNEAYRQIEAANQQKGVAQFKGTGKLTKGERLDDDLSVDEFQTMRGVKAEEILDSIGGLG
jgi:hypothetical protein